MSLFLPFSAPAPTSSVMCDIRLMATDHTQVHQYPEGDMMFADSSTMESVTHPNCHYQVGGDDGYGLHLQDI